MNKTELRVDIIRKFGTQTAFAKEIGWSENKLSKMMQGKYTPDLNEVVFIADKLELEESRFLIIFLDKKSPNGDKKQAEGGLMMKTKKTDTNKGDQGKVS